MRYLRGNVSGSGDLTKRCPRSVPGFTLIEMVVVVGLVLVILGLLLPAAGTIWNERRQSEAENALQGLLMTTRAHAMQANSVESGLFAFVDEAGAQHLVSIERVDKSDPVRQNLFPVWQNVFEITGGRDHLLPAPMRVMPRYAVDDPEGVNDSWRVFSAVELANDSFDDPPEDLTQRHRNFFTLVFTTDGHMTAGRDVLILDKDANEDGTGDRTGLAVGGTTENPDFPIVNQYYPDDGGEPEPLDPDDPTVGVPDSPLDGTALVAGDDNVAINFPSVRGVLVYDDVAFRELLTSEKRGFMLRESQPLYLSRWTGAVVRGSVEGEVGGEE